jgi:hypothetical protein
MGSTLEAILDILREPQVWMSLLVLTLASGAAWQYWQNPTFSSRSTTAPDSGGLAELLLQPPEQDAAAVAANIDRSDVLVDQITNNMVIQEEGVNRASLRLLESTLSTPINARSGNDRGNIANTFDLLQEAGKNATKLPTAQEVRAPRSLDTNTFGILDTTTTTSQSPLDQLGQVGNNGALVNTNSEQLGSTDPATATQPARSPLQTALDHFNQVSPLLTERDRRRSATATGSSADPATDPATPGTNTSATPSDPFANTSGFTGTGTTPTGTDLSPYNTRQGSRPGNVPRSGSNPAMLPGQATGQVPGAPLPRVSTGGRIPTAYDPTNTSGGVSGTINNANTNNQPTTNSTAAPTATPTPRSNIGGRNIRSFSNPW